MVSTLFVIQCIRTRPSKVTSIDICIHNLRVYSAVLIKNFYVFVSKKDAAQNTARRSILGKFLVHIHLAKFLLFGEYSVSCNC